MKAFEQLVYRYEQRIYRFACNACSREPDARELTQDTFVKAFRAIAQYNPEHSFAAWLFTIARHKCIDHLRVPRPLETHEIPSLPMAATLARCSRAMKSSSIFGRSRAMLFHPRNFRRFGFGMWRI